MWILIGFEVQLPSLIYDPTIVEDPIKTPTIVFFLDTNKIPSIVSFYHLKELPKNFCQIMYFDFIYVMVKVLLMGIVQLQV